MFVGDMDNEPLNKFNGGNSFDDELIIIVPVVMKSNMRAGVRIDTGSSNNRSAEIAPNVFRDGRRVTVIGLSVDIEAVRMILINSRFDFLEGRAEFVMETIEQSGTEGIAQKSIVKMFYTLPRSNTSDSDFGDKDMNVRIPLEAASKGVENTDEAGSKMLRFIKFAEHAKDDVTDGMKKAVEQRTISAEKDTKFFRNSEYTMPVNALNDFERHRSSALDRIEISTRRTETAFAAKRNKFERTTRRTPIHSSAVSRISAMNHLFDVFKNSRAGFESVLDFFIMV